MKWFAIAFLIAIAILFIGLRIMFDRTREFRAQARLGQPIVHAIDQYKEDVGKFPKSLSDLVPKYLNTLPELSNRENHKFEGWEYRVITNQQNTTYTVLYYMERGGVEYKPPNWYGNDEGHRKVILKNE